MIGRLLIVGGTGFIGRNLVFNALQQGFSTTVLSLNMPVDEKKVDGVEYLQADITDLRQIEEQLSGTVFDYVVNLSGYIDHSNFLDGGIKIIKSHFEGVQNLLQVIDWKALKRFVQIGSSDEYGDAPSPQIENVREAPISPYSFGKVASTQLLQMLHRTEGLSVVILRLFLVYGPGQSDKRFLPQIITGCKSGNSFPVSAGEQLRDFCYVDDISQGILMSLTNPQVDGEVINLASGKAMSIRKLIEKIQNLIGAGTPEFGKISYRTGENMSLYADTNKANKLLGWTPNLDLDSGLKRTIDYYS